MNPHPEESHMSDTPKDQDPLEMLRRMWSGAGIPLPGMVAPTLDIDELDKRIADLRTVENWLRMNLNMLQATVQGLEVQRSTLAALKAMGAQPPAGATSPPSDNPFAAAMWPWNMMQPPADKAKPAAPDDERPPAGSKPRGRK
jgi:hypothetical protein